MLIQTGMNSMIKLTQATLVEKMPKKNVFWG